MNAHSFRSALLSLTVLVSASACVSAATHEELKGKYDAAQGQLAERGVELESCSQSLASARDEVADLSAKYASEKTRCEAVAAERDRNAEELARTQEQLASLVHDRSQLASTTKQLTDALRQLSERKAQADARVAEFRSLLARFKDLIDAGKLSVRLVDGRMVLALPTDVLFASGSAALSAEGVTAVGEVAQVLAGMADRRFQVEGHTDNLPIHTAKYPSNWELSADRALGVVKAMMQAGMDPHTLSAAAFGEYHPVAENDTDEGRRQNRRIEVVLLPDLSMLPGFEELQSIVEQ